MQKEDMKVRCKVTENTSTTVPYLIVSQDQDIANFTVLYSLKQTLFGIRTIHQTHGDVDVRCEHTPKKELENRNLKPNKVTPPDIAHKDWAYNPGRNDNLKKVYEDKVKALKCKSKNAKGKDVECGFLNVVKDEFKETSKYLKQNDKLFNDVKSLFTTKKPKTIELCKSDIFGDEKRVLLSSDSVQSHLDRK